MNDIQLAHPLSHALWSNELNTIFYGEGRKEGYYAAAVSDGWMEREKGRRVK